MVHFRPIENKGQVMYPHILTRLVNTPLLITEDKLEILTSEVSLKLLMDMPIDRSAATPDAPVVETANHIAVIPVYGSLVNKNGAGSSGMTSYQRTKDSTIAAIESGIKHIVYDVSSPGGEAAGAFPLADFIHSLPTKYGVNTYGFTDSQAASGGYIILAAAEKVFATDIADVGSIGAIMSLVDVTAADKEDGVKYTVLRSKENKAGYNPHEVVTDKVISDLQSKLQVLDTRFNNSMVKYRNGKLSMETIMSLAGKTVDATEGLSLGLVDTIVTSIEDVFSAIQSTVPVKQTASNNLNQRSTTMSDVTLEKYVALQAENASLKEAQSLAIATAVQGERTRCATILSSASTFNISTAEVSKAITKAWPLDMVADYFSGIAEASDKMTAIHTAAGTMGADATEIATAAASVAAASVKGFDAEIAAGIDAMIAEPTLFKGMN